MEFLLLDPAPVFALSVDLDLQLDAVVAEPAVQGPGLQQVMHP
jgi:hypothetical protein